MADTKATQAAQQTTAAQGTQTTAPEKPVKTDKETPEQFKARLNQWEAGEHQRMLKEIASKRIPLVVERILSVGGLVNHLPTPAQQEKIIAQLQTAVDTVKKQLAGTEKPAAGFSLD